MESHCAWLERLPELALRMSNTALEITGFSSIVLNYATGERQKQDSFGVWKEEAQVASCWLDRQEAGVKHLPEAAPGCSREER